MNSLYYNHNDLLINCLVCTVSDLHEKNKDGLATHMLSFFIGVEI